MLFNTINIRLSLKEDFSTVIKECWNTNCCLKERKTSANQCRLPVFGEKMPPFFTVTDRGTREEFLLILKLAEFSHGVFSCHSQLKNCDSFFIFILSDIEHVGFWHEHDCSNSPSNWNEAPKVKFLPMVSHNSGKFETTDKSKSSTSNNNGCGQVDNSLRWNFLDVKREYKGGKTSSHSRNQSSNNTDPNPLTKVVDKEAYTNDDLTNNVYWFSTKFVHKRLCHDGGYKGT